MVRATPKCHPWTNGSSWHCIFQVQEQALQVARVTKIIDPGTDDTKQPSNILRVVGENTLWLFNITMENGPFIDGLPI